MYEDIETLSIGGMTRPFHFYLGDNTLPAILFIHGYCQSGVETWRELIPTLQRYVNNTLIVVERLPTADFPPGRVSPERQADEMVEIAEALIQNGWVIPTQQIVWVGHSLGGTFAQRLTNTYPKKTAGIVQIAPPASCGWWILFYLRFWWWGGVLGLFPAFWSWLTGQAVRYPRWMVRGLFAGTHCQPDVINRYLPTLQPDSGRLFPEFLLTQGVNLAGDELTNARKHGFTGKSVIIGCTQDRIVSRLATCWLAWRSDSQLRWIDEAHCWWVQSQREQTKSTIIAAIKAVLAL